MSDRTPLETIIAAAVKSYFGDEPYGDRHGLIEMIASEVREWLRLPHTDAEIDAALRAWRENAYTRPPNERMPLALAAFVAVLTGDADE